ncbi:MAG: AzlC family ABC transporter permease [Christensenellaceae bacterium]|nr:AzlC family ABC transporter permease [Christensenellaceae bacterium]
MKDGIPIALGYFAVALALGIVARNAGVTALQGFFSSLITISASGEYAGFAMMAEKAPYIELAVMTFIINARYILMSLTLSQKFHESTSLLHRAIIGFFVTDELFAITAARKGYINPYYTYGAAFVAAPAWALGTGVGIVMGNILPSKVVSALSVALFGMFLALTVPAAKNNKVIFSVIIISYIASFVFPMIPAFSGISDGMKAIILTIIIASVYAVLFPREEGEA